MKKILLNARPHPRGEGESYPVSVEYLQLDLQDTREEIQNARFLFPLLGEKVRVRADSKPFLLLNPSQI